MKFEQITKIRLPYDLRNKDANKDYGVGSLYNYFILKGEKGSVQYVVSFPVFLPHIKIKDDLASIYGVDVGCHYLSPLYDEQKPLQCAMHGKCYYAGSGLVAEKWTKEIFSVRGTHPEKIIWKKLEKYYLECFEV